MQDSTDQPVVGFLLFLGSLLLGQNDGDVRRCLRRRLASKYDRRFYRPVLPLLLLLSNCIQNRLLGAPRHRLGPAERGGGRVQSAAAGRRHSGRQRPRRQLRNERAASWALWGPLTFPPFHSLNTRQQRGPDAEQQEGLGQALHGPLLFKLRGQTAWDGEGQVLPGKSSGEECPEHTRQPSPTGSPMCRHHALGCGVCTHNDRSH